MRLVLGSFQPFENLLAVGRLVALQGRITVQRDRGIIWKKVPESSFIFPSKTFNINPFISPLPPLYTNPYPSHQNLFFISGKVAPPLPSCDSFIHYVCNWRSSRRGKQYPWFCLRGAWGYTRCIYQGTAMKEGVSAR